jgi:predicted ATP-grasp superfamily ATP-dependent carboligase/protein-tyrosine phosphatase
MPRRRRKKMKVFVTDANYKHTLGAVRALANEGVDVHVGSNARMALSFYSKHVSKRFLYPKPTLSASFLRTIARIDDQENYDAILPVGNSAWFSFVTSGSGELKRKIPMPPLDSYMIAYDKVRTLAFAENHGIPMPETVFPEEPESRITQLCYPVIMKPAFGSGNARVFLNLDEAMAYRRGLQHKGKQAVFQEFVYGEGYGFFALYSHGKRIAFFMHRRIREMPPGGGSSSAAEAVYVPELLSLGTKVLDSLAWHGVAMVEFRRNARTGEFELLEINPKFWGSLDLAIAAGVNFPYLAARMVAFGDCSPPATYNHVKFCWPIPDDFRHLRRRPTSAFAILHDWTSFAVKKNIWLNDLGPHLALIDILTTSRARRAVIKIRNGIAFAIKPRMFGWVVPNRIAASSRPRLPSQLIWLKKQGVKAILDLTEKPAFLEAALPQFGGHYVNVPMRDHASPTLSQLERAVNFVVDENKCDRAALVHCLGGLGRTGTVLACCLIRMYGVKAMDAIRAVRLKRPGSIEELQEASVLQYADSLRDKKIHNRKLG